MRYRYCKPLSSIFDETDDDSNVREFIEAGNDIHFVFTQTGRCLLEEYAWSGNVKAVRYLVNQGVHVDMELIRRLKKKVMGVHPIARSSYFPLPQLSRVFRLLEQVVYCEKIIIWMLLPQSKCILSVELIRLLFQFIKIDPSFDDHDKKHLEATRRRWNSRRFPKNETETT